MSCFCDGEEEEREWKTRNLANKGGRLDNGQAEERGPSAEAVHSRGVPRRQAYSPSVYIKADAVVRHRAQPAKQP